VRSQANDAAADLVVVGGKIATQDVHRSFTSAVAARDGRIVAIGSEAEALARGGRAKKVVDAGERTVIPGLTDSHMHFIREGWQYHAELRWDGIPTLAEALARLREQADRTPPSQWVRVVGSWSEFQFAERRAPTIEEINAAAPNVPALILHVYHDALLNRPGLAAQKIGPQTAPPPGGEITRDAQGNPTGLLIAKPTAPILYAAVAALPKLARAEQVNSTLHFARELNRLGLTGVVDAGGGSQFYPDDYEVVTELARTGQLTLRVAYNLFPQRPGHELEDFTLWAGRHSPGEGDEMFRINGMGETLVFTAADYENFQEARPELDPSMEGQLTDVVRFLVQHRWPFRLHASYNESIERFLNVFEEVNDRDPLSQVRWYFDHAETISDRSLDRVHKLGGGVAVQDRMAFQGEHFVERYGESAAADAPPIAKMLSKGIPVSGGTDATRVASYNPWVALHWLITGKTVGGAELAKPTNRLSRMEALRMMTVNSAWFSAEEGTKGSLEVGQRADLAILSDDYFSIPEESIPGIESLLTVVGGRIVYAAGPFAPESPPPLPAVIPSWSPVAVWGGSARPSRGVRPGRPTPDQRPRGG
jgi:predicted amidohydrolase YtcJ